jgi:hypothetical protein
LIFEEAISDLKIFCKLKKNNFMKQENNISFKLKLCDVLYIIENILETFQ